MQLDNQNKESEIVQKYTSLLEENKPYEFVQKIKLLSHRKQQMKKINEAESLLLLGLEKIMSDSNAEQNDAYDLFEPLLTLYGQNRQRWNIEKGKRVYGLLNIRQNNEKKFYFYVKFIKTVKNGAMPTEMIKDLINFYVKNDQFTKAESHVIELDFESLKSFFQQWSSKVSSEEATAIQCRLALLRGIFGKFQDCEKMLEGVDADSPFFRFTSILLNCTKLQSRQAYNLIGTKYEEFFARDVLYNKIYQGYGASYFKIDNSKKGNSLLSMFQ